MPDNLPDCQGADSPPDEAIAATAAMWLARCDRGLAAGETREFERWRAADPRHAGEFIRIERAWRNADLAKADPQLAAMAQALDERTRHRRHRSWPRMALLAAAAAVVVMLWIARRPASTPENPANPAIAASPAAKPAYQVIPSDARHLVLADGSTVELRGTSEVRAEYSPGERRVQLVRGEAYFVVTKDPARPFVVRTAAVAVHAVGTAFNVRVEPAKRIEVLVTEGKVRVTDAAHGATLLPAIVPARANPATGTHDTHEASRDSLDDPLLVAGHRAVMAIDAASGVAAKAEITAVDRADVERSLEWQDTLLVFQRTSLGDAVDAFNQHSTQRLVLGDPALRQRLLGGTFRPGNVEAFVRLLEQGVDVKAEHRADGVIVLWPAP